MPDFNHWSLFFAAATVLLLIPGPSVLYVVTRGIEHGYRGVVFSSLGLALGDLLQVLCTAVGLSALLSSSLLLFSIVKYVGAAYLITLSARQLLSKSAASLRHLAAAGVPARQVSSHVLIVQAFFTLNPKTAIFFLALFPQFVAANAGPAWLQILLFGCTFVLFGFMTNSMYGCLGGTLTSIVKRNAKFHAAARYFSGAVLIGMGIVASLASTSHTT